VKFKLSWWIKFSSGGLSHGLTIRAAGRGQRCRTARAAQQHSPKSDMVRKLRFRHTPYKLYPSCFSGKINDTVSLTLLISSVEYCNNLSLFKCRFTRHVVLKQTQSKLYSNGWPTYSVPFQDEHCTLVPNLPIFEIGSHKHFKSIPGIFSASVTYTWENSTRIGARETWETPKSTLCTMQQFDQGFPAVFGCPSEICPRSGGSVRTWHGSTTEKAELSCRLIKEKVPTSRDSH